ncbi:hypothetical protein [Teichococcus aestuarii]|uniref:hypothetical protein n=1 Tax=Teichococcus aestuarii TaxID=568898 RepID=UPI00361A58D2
MNQFTTSRRAAFAVGMTGLAAGLAGPALAQPSTQPSGTPPHPHRGPMRPARPAGRT